MRHPEQPTEFVEGVKRFKKNKIVSYLLDTGNTDLNKLWVMQQNGKFSMEDMEQLYQLIGYSVCGFEDVFSREEDE
jgi:hypothetical protein